MSINIFRATREDIPGIMELYAQEGWKGDTVPSEIIYDKNKFILVAKDENNKVVGTAQLDIIQSLAFGDKKYGVVEFVVTDKEHRRQGIMKQIFQKIDEICLQENCESIMLTSSLPRMEAHLFYEKMGYVAPVRGFRKEYPEGAITKREANIRKYKMLAEQEEKKNNEILPRSFERGLFLIKYHIVFKYF